MDKQEVILKESNNLIAEFMGGRIVSIWPEHTSWDIPDMDGYQHVLFYAISWDWLMPVVSKCMNEFSEMDQHDRLFQAINNGLMSVDICDTYDAVVDFIKTYNNGRQN